MPAFARIGPVTWTAFSPRKASRTSGLRLVGRAGEAGQAAPGRSRYQVTVVPGAGGPDLWVVAQLRSDRRTWHLVEDGSSPRRRSVKALAWAT